MDFIRSGNIPRVVRVPTAWSRRRWGAARQDRTDHVRGCHGRGRLINFSRNEATWPKVAKKPKMTNAAFVFVKPHANTDATRW